MAIRVLIAEDDPEVRTALADLVSSEIGMELAGVAGDADEAIAVAEQVRPDVVLLDVRMPGGGGVRAATEIRERVGDTRVLALSAHDDRSTVLQMLQAGAVGFLVKGANADEIVGAIRRMASGQSSLSAEVTGEVIRELVGQLELRDHEADKNRRRMDLMRRVVEGRGLRMVFQPIVDLATGTPVGTEALARFEGTPVRPPDVWFAEAAALGLRVDLELAAVRLALAHLHLVIPPQFLAVNLSPETAASPSFMSLLGDWHVERVVCEISEHARVDDYEALNASLDTLRSGGGRLAIDDAGAGFASLQHILRLRPDYIKLDMTLTRGVDTDPARRALASALTSFAHEIGALIIAEGIESEREKETLSGLGITLGQGYYLAYPQPLADPAPVEQAPVGFEQPRGTG
jgi:EAL domain-containing protein (putative c-di-GMP-specific phosphodiesterase class I)/CheY-like chemotaxis protein